MTDISNLSIFIAASLALIVAPGPDILYVVTRGITQGRRAGLLSAAGVTAGILVHTIFAALGLAVILRTSALAFTAVKYAGAAYLIYLGLKTLKDKTSFTPRVAEQNSTERTIFLQGVLSNVFNPKVALFFLAFLPQFVKNGSENPALTMIVLGLLFAGMGLTFLLLLAFFAGQVGSWLQKKPRFAAKLRWISGAVFIFLGLRLAFLKQR